MKGSSFERKMSKDFSLWWTKGERNDVFYRTHGSGSRFTSGNKTGCSPVNSAGDLCSMDPIGFPFLDLFHVELKKGYSGRRRFSSKKVKGEIVEIIKKPGQIDVEKLTEVVKRWAGNTKTASVGDFVLKTKGKPLIFEWWEKSEDERKKTERLYSLIVFEKDGYFPAMFIERDCLENLREIFGPYPYPHAILNASDFVESVILRLEDFFRWADPDIIARLFTDKEIKNVS